MTDPEGVSVLIADEDLRYQAPLPGDFGQHEFVESEVLRELAGEVVAEFFEPREDWQHQTVSRAWASGDITVLWKLRGGRALAKCMLPPALARYLGAKTWLIWVAADHAREGAYGREKLSAVLHHELLHVGIDIASGKPGIVPHDAEVFAEEIADHGVWRDDLLPLVMACRDVG